ncbi:YhcH/YjgK/YiaL family protein [Mycoplasma sp. Z244B]|uniref:YhcH/YjgK/YiaL family protein n=1 Tax=Mycoplasma sp. Z244B TaxID=3401659 RepID=UPI003AACC30C
MIFDKLSNIKKYQVNPAIKAALELAANADFDTYEYGIHEFNDDIKLVKRNFSPLFEENYGELHDQHIDIHVYYAGDEVIYFDPQPHYTQTDILSASKPNDVFYIKAPQYHNQIRLSQGTFALFFPGELHKITFANEQLTNKDKIIIKVKY